MVLYVSATKGSKPEKTNWVMHQYHLGTGEDEKDGEFVVSKIFYQQQLRPCDRKGELIFETADEVVGEFENVGCTGSATPDCHDENQNLIQTSEENSIQTKVGYDPVNDNNDINPELEGFATQNDADHHWSTKADNHGIPAPDSQPAEEPKWWEGESQFLLDSQQLADGIALCEEFLHSQSSCADEEGKSSRPCLSDYARMGVENLKRDLEECQNLSRDGDGRDLEECEKLSQDGDGNGSNIELDTALDMRLSQLDCGDGSNGLNIELDTASEMRLSQIEFGSQDSFMAWAEGKLV
ncbi:hypothetical protein HPP92_005979 [Vanilla planifolia]|uniref:NAC domain-containing protein n=1 Tax=Vanilla planifolia TaxID=51239 RepID=A0A835RV06_VANPL|nr:hypothetical protein HPP92_005979 [Vanilla planifolia]